MEAFCEWSPGLFRNCAVKAIFYTPETLFLQRNQAIMDQHSAPDPKEKDFTHNWVNSSVFLFYLQIFILIAFTFGCAYGLYSKRYKGRPEVPVQSSSQYTPAYK